MRTDCKDHSPAGSSLGAWSCPWCCPSEWLSIWGCISPISLSSTGFKGPETCCPCGQMAGRQGRRESWRLGSSLLDWRLPGFMTQGISCWTRLGKSWYWFHRPHKGPITPHVSVHTVTAPRGLGTRARLGSMTSPERATLPTETHKAAVQRVPTNVHVDRTLQLTKDFRIGLSPRPPPRPHCWFWEGGRLDPSDRWSSWDPEGSNGHLVGEEESQHLNSDMFGCRSAHCTVLPRVWTLSLTLTLTSFWAWTVSYPTLLSSLWRWGVPSLSPSSHFHEPYDMHQKLYIHGKKWYHLTIKNIKSKKKEKRKHISCEVQQLLPFGCVMYVVVVSVCTAWASALSPNVVLHTFPHTYLSS